MISWKFSATFKASLTNFVKSLLLVPLETVDCKLLEISRKVTFRNIPIHVLEISEKLQNAEIYTVTLPKSVFITDAYLTISKILGTLTGNFSSGVSFSAIIGGRIGQVELHKRHATFPIFYNFQNKILPTFSEYVRRYFF